MKKQLYYVRAGAGTTAKADQISSRGYLMWNDEEQKYTRGAAIKKAKLFGECLFVPVPDNELKPFEGYTVAEIMEESGGKILAFTALTMVLPRAMTRDHVFQILFLAKIKPSDILMAGDTPVDAGWFVRKLKDHGKNPENLLPAMGYVGYMTSTNEIHLFVTDSEEFKAIDAIINPEPSEEA